MSNNQGSSKVKTHVQNSAMRAFNAHMHHCGCSAGSCVCQGVRPQGQKASALSRAA